MNSLRTRLVRSAARYLGGAVFLGALAGCAMINPYVSFDEYSGGKPPARVRPASPATLPQAKAFLDSTAAHYRNALQDRAEFRNLLGLSLLPLAGAATGFGIEGTSSTAILAMALAGVTAQGAAIWLDNRPAERAYLFANSSLVCAADAVAPLNLSAGGSGTSMNALLDNLTKLNGTMAASESAAGATRAELGMQRALLPEAFITGVERDLVTAAAALQAAESAYSNGEKLRIEVESAGDRLVIAVEKITGLVDTAVQANQPDMRALTDILANLGTAYSKFTVVPSPSASAAETAAAASKSTDGAQSGRNGTASTLRLSAAEQAKASVTDARKAMLDQLATMNSHRRAVAAIVNVVAANTPFAALANCGVDTSALAAGIAFDPSGPITLVQGTAAQFGRTVVGGKAPYSVTMSQAPAGLSVRQSGAFEPAFEVHATAEVPVGSYNIVAADGAGHRAHLPVVVGPPPATNEKLKQRNDTTEAEQTRQMQRALCVPVDGVLGTETKQAFDAYGGLPAAAGKSKQDLKEELLNMRPDQIAARCTTPGGVAAGVQVTPTTALLTTIGGLIQDSSVEAKTAAGTARWFRIDKATVSGDGKRLVLHLTPGAGTGKPSLEEVRAAVNGLIIRQDKPAFDPSVIEIENWAALDLQP